MPNPRLTAVLFLAGAAALAGCESNPLQVQRSPCPAVAIPTYTGDTTLFTPGSTQDAANIDVVATMTNVRESCSETAESFISDITYDVVASRTASAGARTVTLPVFATVVQGGNLLVSKEVGTVNVAFADGQTRAIGKGGARGTVSRAVATLPSATLAKINRKRKAGDLDAAVDPLSDPEVRAAIRAASFEVLIGFQLGESALAYNVTK